MRLDDFNYTLPDSLIATAPVSPRDHSRLLVIRQAPFSIEHRRFYEIGNFLKPGDMLVGNNTKVIPARVTPLGDRGYEVLFLEKLNTTPLEWTALCLKSKRLKVGETLAFPGNVCAQVVSKENAQVQFRFPEMDDARFLDWLHTVGKPPLPPYIARDTRDDDKTNYQTVYASREGAVAAPTAGLHFTNLLLSQLRNNGVSFEELTLHVGPGTFSPIRSENLSDHRMHTESYEISEGLLGRIASAKSRGAQVVSVGTTSLRALESVERFGTRGKTDLFITPGHPFHSATALLTNFHLPKSTLFILVCAFLGREQTLAAYEEAIRQKYRFYSYGDAMLILPA